MPETPAVPGTPAPVDSPAAEVFPATEALEVALRNRAELHGVIVAFEAALASPVPGRAEAWRAQAAESLARMEAAFTEHIAVTEGSSGLYAEVLDAAPRLSHAVNRLKGEHEEIRAALAAGRTRVEGAAADPTARSGDAGEGEAVAVRDLLTTLLGRLVRHRQRGADLLFEAYNRDLGGVEM